MTRREEKRVSEISFYKWPNNIRLPSDSSFRFLRNFVDTKDHIEKFLAEKPERFWKHEIFKLRERWRKVVEENGTYIIR